MASYINIVSKYNVIYLLFLHFKKHNGTNIMSKIFESNEILEDLIFNFLILIIFLIIIQIYLQILG